VPPPAVIEAPATAASAHANGADADSDADGADGMRRRRRRGRRGGRGRRRGNAAGGANEELALGDDVVSTIDTESSEDFDMDSRDAAPQMAAAAVPAPVPAAPAVTPAPAVAAAPVEHSYAPVAASAPAPVVAAAAAAGSVTTASSQDLAALAIAKGKEFFTMMGFDAQITAKADGTRVDVTVEVGQDDDLLTGVRGETRAALEHLLNRFINTGEGSRYHLQLEINDFWLRREEELAAQAREMADKAVASNAEVVTEYMNSQERRIIHVTLKEDSRVKTYSLGTDRSKRVAIAPADFPDRTDEELAG
jgi:predicted RNA-binding protein Jag